ncbi:phospholipase D-like domain-containing protein [Bradyrhizobium barranii subsp. apii]|uniref:phospholipase D-like domain-containing protein n=1 Tax=Bradyrhizobium barranii TaxID=2992140 RepID=UPI001AA1592A|nr:phospholipase D-like domain-containing protein [Bradyrhizobium barranii]UPT99443.1 phospholipase D-like domain-containing protein [Bradyrhizobium barranii subsp. apii]
MAKDGLKDISIPGNRGTEPVPDQAVPPAMPPASSERTGTLVDTPDGVFVQFGNSRIRLDRDSVARLRSTQAPLGSPSPGGRTEYGDLANAIKAVAEHGKMLKALPGVIAVRAGYKFTNGQISRVPCVVVAVDRKMENVRAEDRVPPVLDGVPTDVTVADPYERVAASGREAAAMVQRPRLLIDEVQPGAFDEAFLEALPQTTYEPPKGLDLKPVSGAMSITCHVSPDAGWRVLKPFLAATRKSIWLGMYDFTAPHIYDVARTVLRDSDIEWTQTLGPNEALPSEDDVDSPKAGDLTEERIVRGLKRLARDRFNNAFAHIGSGKTFASAYHIKVAVRDGTAFWLSSGNWQSSNQPDIDFFEADTDRQQMARYNREWHVVVENVELAKRFQGYLDYDFQVASEKMEEEEAAPQMPELLIPFDETMVDERAALDLDVFPPKTFTFSEDEPLTVQPILTPDNYIEVVLKFLRKKPSKSLYFQNQSLNPVKDPSAEFEEMMDLLAKYSNDENLDVRLIFRNIGPTRKKLESLQLAGFNMSRIRMQAGCHTKGIIVDSERILLGSHNFTNQGVQVNRDASLMLRHKGIAQYYERVFLHDWEKLARRTVREEAMPVPDVPGREAFAESNAVRVPWSYYDED